MSEGVLIKIPTKISISAVFHSVCKQVGAWQQTPKVCPWFTPFKTVSACVFDHGPFKQFVHMLQNCKIWALPKNIEWNNKLLLDWRTSIVTANLHKVAEDFKYVHSISSQGLCWAVKGKGGTFNNSLKELWKIFLKKRIIGYYLIISLAPYKKR